MLKHHCGNVTLFRSTKSKRGRGETKKKKTRTIMPRPATSCWLHDSIFRPCRYAFRSDSGYRNTTRPPEFLLRSRDTACYGRAPPVGRDCPAAAAAAAAASRWFGRAGARNAPAAATSRFLLETISSFFFFYSSFLSTSSDRPQSFNIGGKPNKGKGNKNTK